MIVKRAGNKSKLANDIVKHFPKHELYVDLYFGSGGMFFNKYPIAKYNICNDIDDNITNIYLIMQDKEQTKKLYKKLYEAPISMPLFRYLKKQDYSNDNIKKAFKFIYLVNYSLYGSGGSLKIGIGNSKQFTLMNIKKIHNIIKNNNVIFTNFDYRRCLDSITISNRDLCSAFIYADPPYYNTSSKYCQNWNTNNFIDLLDTLIATKIRFAVSGYDDNFALGIAKHYNLNYIKILERRTIMARNTEILITNYEQENELFNERKPLLNAA